MIETDTAAFTHWDLSSGVVDNIQAFEIPTAQLDLSLTGLVYSGNVDGHGLVKMNFNIQNKVVASPLSGTLIHPDTDQSPLLQGVYCQIHAKPEIDESSDQTILRALGSAFGSIFRVVH